MKSKKGFTLVELIIALVVLSTIMIVVSEVYLRGMISSRTEISESQLRIEAKNAMDGITANIKQSALVEPSYGEYTSSAASIVLATPAIDQNDEFLYSGDNKIYDHIVYYIQGSQLHKAVISEDSRSKMFPQNGSNRAVLKDAKSLTFTYDPDLNNVKTVTVNLIVENDTQKSSQEVSLKAEAKLRND